MVTIRAPLNQQTDKSATAPHERLGQPPKPSVEPASLILELRGSIISIKRFTKDPEAVLDYTLDWTAWLPTGDSILLVEVTAETGLTVDSYSYTDTDTTAWISGGTAGTSYLVTFHITTDGGREEDRSITITGREK